MISHKKRLYDVPDARKVHTMPVPRLGGLSFFPVDPDVDVLGDRFSSVLLGCERVRLVIQYAL